MHSEIQSAHTTMIKMLYEFKHDMEDKTDSEGLKFLEMNRGFEEQHKSIIDRFGRYPHRNAVLGRQPTDEEQKYMADGGETFGVAG